MKLKTINDIKDITPVKVKKVDLKDVKGGDILPLYSNVYCTARKNSGKTNVIAHIIKECCDKHTKVFGIVPTYQKDLTWIAIRERLEKKKIPHEFYSHINDDDALNNILEQIEDVVSSDEDEDEDEEPQPQILRFEDEMRIKYKPRKPKKKSCRYCIILDDASEQLKDKRVVSLLKRNRHHKCKVILSSQYANDCSPQMHKNIDVHLIFKGLSEDKLKEFYKNCDVSVTFQELKEMYEACSEKYSFFYMNAHESDFRCKFNKKFILDDDDTKN